MDVIGLVKGPGLHVLSVLPQCPKGADIRAAPLCSREESSTEWEGPALSIWRVYRPLPTPYIPEEMKLPKGSCMGNINEKI